MKTPSYSEFDLLKHPLSGRTLIEASAGTGKTYTITRLFLRLLLEKGLDISSLLVVTFTEAATQELKERIFRALREALNSLNGKMSDDTFIEELMSRHDTASAKDTITNALRSFDTISVFTIHGFCRRILTLFAFESGSNFDIEIVGDQRQLMEEIVQDYWRTHFYNASPLQVSYALEKGYGPEFFAALLSKGNRIKLPHVLPDLTPTDLTKKQNAYLDAVAALKKMWLRSRSDIITLLNMSSLNKNMYKEKTINKFSNEMDQFLERPIPSPTLFPDFKRFTSSYIEKNTKKGKIPKQHIFFDACQKLAHFAHNLRSEFDDNLLAMQAEFFEYARKEMVRRKEEKNIIYFDDLLRKVHWALHQAENRSAFKSTILQNYKAALIDEFQDTDPIQYEIFDTLYQDGTMFIIGDPKQAIYGFRGADVFTYIKAARAVDNRFTLRTNYRSEAPLIDAVNTLFSRSTIPFVLDAIGYSPVRAGKDTNNPLTVDGAVHTPFTLWFIDKQTHKGEPIGPGEARTRISHAVAAEIGRLLDYAASGRSHIGKNPLRPQDIAILVRTNAEADMMRTVLREYDIPAVLESSNSVFATNEANDLEIVLSAIAEPNHLKRIKTALIMPFFGKTADAIDALNRNEYGWDYWIERFFTYHELWRDRGFMVMIRTFMLNEGIRSRILALKGGERILTNILHLFELIHTEERTQHHGISHMLKWFTEKRQSSLRPSSSNHTSDEEMMRLESDMGSIRIVTIHKSKGLEYPVVFCPFCWNGAEIPKNGIRAQFFHDSTNNDELCLALGEDTVEQYRPIIECESLAEQMRLLYVALTRAKTCCYFVWGTIKYAESSAAGYLLHSCTTGISGNTDSIESNPNCSQSFIDNFKEKLATLSSTQLWSELRELSRVAQGTIEVHPLPDFDAHHQSIPDNDAPDLKYRTFKGSIPSPWGIASFTSFTHNAHHIQSWGVQMESIDEQVGTGIEETDEHPLCGIAAFPRGAKTGTFLHELIQNLDFSRTYYAATKLLIEEKCALYGFENTWHPTIEELIENLVTTPLDDARTIRLYMLQPSDCIPEMEFYIPLNPISPDSLRQIFLSSGLQTDLFDGEPYVADGLEFSPTKGFLKGYIDLVFQHDGMFYLVDWKSNYLGPSPLHYASHLLKHTMHREHYVLQYHLYLVALHQYLSLRIPRYDYDRHFGGVYYIFLRGISSELGPHHGIYHDRPNRKRITHLTNLLVKKNRK